MIRRVVVVAFAQGRVVVPPVVWESDGSSHYDGAQAACISQAGVRFQHFHPMREVGGELLAWADGDPIRPLATTLPLDEALAHGGVVAEAVRSFLDDTDEAYYADTMAILDAAYLAAPTPEGGSGHSGDARRWRISRGIHAEAIDRDGTFLDTGCANGLLMETMAVWARERGFTLEPYGLDISPRMAEEARRRLPPWAGRIWVGNAIDWDPPFRFDFVAVRLEYVREPRRRELVERLLRDVVAPGGRLIVTSYGNSTDPVVARMSVGDVLRSWGYDVKGEPTSREHELGKTHRIAYLDAPR